MKMKSKTLNVLKNFSSINPTLCVNAGNVIRSVSQNKTILAEARLDVDQSFPRDFAIYDLSEFLGVMSLFEECDVDFKENHVELRVNNASSNYYYAEREMVTIPPEKELVLPDEPINFTLREKVLRHLLQAASVMKLPELVVNGDGNQIVIKALNSKNPSSNDFKYEVGETDQVFNMIFKVENLKLISGSYNVTISSKRLARFLLEDDSMTYWIATETQSTFG